MKLLSSNSGFLWCFSGCTKNFCRFQFLPLVPFAFLVGCILSIYFSARRGLLTNWHNDKDKKANRRKHPNTIFSTPSSEKEKSTTFIFLIWILFFTPGMRKHIPLYLKMFPLGIKELYMKDSAFNSVALWARSLQLALVKLIDLPKTWSSFCWKSWLFDSVQRTLGSLHFSHTVDWSFCQQIPDVMD